MNVYHLNTKELPLLFPIGHAFTAEAGRPPFSEETFAASWTELLKWRLGELYVAEENDRIVATLGATFAPDPFTGILTALECFWYVLPEFRKTGVGLTLLDCFEQRAQMRGCKQILMVHFAHMGASLQKLYEGRGYSLLEQTFRKEIK